MTNAPPLSIAYIERNPMAASRVLENLAPEDSAALIDLLPARISGLALGRMTPLAAAQCLGSLNAERAAHAISAMKFQDAASVLRVMDDAICETVLAALPADLARDFGKSMNHPRDSVGAWMDQRISPLPSDRTVSDALKYAKRKRRPEGDELFIVDSARHYLGVVRISDLVQRDGKTVLKDMIRSDVPPLLNRATLASVVNSPHWDDHASLAVVGRKGTFLGILSCRQARAGLAASRRRSVSLTPNSIITHLLNGFVVTAIGLLGLVVHSADIRPAPPASGERHGG